MAHWIMQVLTGLFSIWDPDFDEEVWPSRPMGAMIDCGVREQIDDDIGNSIIFCPTGMAVADVGSGTD